MNNFAHNVPSINQKEIKAVTRVLKSNWLIPGIEVKNLENNIKKFVNTKYAVAVNSGSSALHLSLIALNIGPHDEVIIPTYTCTALINAVYYTGAVPVIADIESNGFDIDPTEIKNKINQSTKAIIVPHTFGFPARIDEILKFKIPVIEDCAHAIGSYYKGKALGSYGDISIFSFYATKVLTTGHGGMVLTSNKKYYQIIKDLIQYDHRKTFKVSYNYQLTDILAGIGNAQFNKLLFFIKRRKHIASLYRDILDKNNNIEYFPKRDSNLNTYRFVIKFKSKKIRDNFKLMLSRKGVPTTVPIDSYQLLHRYLKLDKTKFPNAEKLSKTSLSLPMHPGLTKKDVEKTLKSLESLFSFWTAPGPF